MNKRAAVQEEWVGEHLMPFLKRILFCLICLTATGCSFLPAKAPVSMESARSMISKRGYQIVSIGITLDRPVVARTAYGICKDGKGNEYAYEIDTKTKTVRTTPLGVNGYLTYEQMTKRLVQQGRSSSDIQKNLVLMLTQTDMFYWQWQGQTWNLEGKLITFSNY